MEEKELEITYDKSLNRNKCIVIFLALLFISNFVMNASSIQKITYVYALIQNITADPTFVVNALFSQTFKTILVYLIPFSFDTIIITVTSIIYIILLVRLFIKNPKPKTEADKILSQVLLVHFILTLVQGLSYIIVGIVLLIFPSVRNDILFVYPVAFDFVTGGVVLAWCVLMVIVYRIFKSKKR